MPVTLEQLLQSRDNRAKHQKDLLEAHSGRSLLCMTVQLPGPEKRNDTSLAIARAGVEAIREAFEPEYEELRDLASHENADLVLIGVVDDLDQRLFSFDEAQNRGKVVGI